MKANGILLRISIVALGAASLAACGTAGPRAEDDATELYSNDQAGDAPIPGVVRIAGIDRSSLETDGTVRYRVENLSSEDVPNLTARVVFYYPPGAEQTGIALPYVTDVTEETEFRLFRGQDDYEIVATSREFAARAAAGDAILATRLDVEQEKPIAITARDGASAGTRVMKGRLECVAISPQDERLGMDGAPPELWLDFANISGERVKNVQFSAVFMDTQGDAVVAQTDWAALPTLEPGDTGRVEFDLSGVGSVRHLPFLVRARLKLRIN